MLGAEAAPSLVRFGHCEKVIYAFGVPRGCPLCGRAVGGALQDAPVGIPSPFTSAHRERCCFALRPTQGSFLRDYDGKSDLHVGITGTGGSVYNYSAHGVRRDTEGWEQSLSVQLLQPGMLGLQDQWDRYLEDFSASGAWQPHRYEQNSHNCYSYALTFINCVLAAEGRGPLDKHAFTEKYVVPRTRLASKYIVLYRAVAQHGFYAADPAGPEARP
ncbi:MKRN2 opposite strand protein [Ctenodactylus gundi]